MRALFRAAPLLAATLPLAPAFAADTAVPAFAPAESDETTEPGIIVQGVQQKGYVPTETNMAKIPAALRDIPQSIAVIPQEVLRDQRALSLQDALKNVPGIGLGHGDGQRDQIFIRGFTAIADQFVDGFRDDGLYFRDLSNVDRVEVVKGPAAVLYGRGSSGGLINRVSKKPDVNILSGTVTFGSFGLHRGEFDVGRFNKSENLGSVGFRLTGAYEDSDSFRSQQFLKRKALAPSLLLGRGSDTSLLVQADWLVDSRLTDFGIPAINGRPVDVPRSTYYGAANAKDADVSRSEVFSQSLTLAHRFSDAISFRNGFRHYRYTLDRHNSNVTAAQDAANTVSISHGGILRDEDGWSNQAELTTRFELAGIRHVILWGWEQSRQVKGAETIAARVVATTSATNPVLPVINPAAFLALSASNVNRFNTTGLYAQDLIDFGHGLKALVGIRHDRFQQTTTQRIAGQPNLARTDKAWSPRAGLVFQPDAQQSYYASWSKSFQPSGEAFALAATNADIAPERTINKEIGAKYTLLGGRLSINAAAFILKRSGIKGTDPATNRVIPIGTQRTRGVELSGTLDLPSGIRAIAGYSYLDSKVTVSANPLFANRGATLTPKNQANLFVTRTIAKHYGIGGGGNYVANRWADAANTTILPHYVTADVMGWAEFGPLRLQINVNNITDKTYIISGHGTSAWLNLPGAPRSVLGTARLSF